ncbi:MAG: hypothetical protein KDA83_19915 [Planctomycetales bacterium]|nr:hypothetical protein [Planctomycetales bacterium]
MEIVGDSLKPFVAVLRVKPTIDGPFDPPLSPCALVCRVMIYGMAFAFQISAEHGMVTHECTALFRKLVQIDGGEQLGLIEKHAEDDHFVGFVEAGRFQSLEPGQECVESLMFDVGQIAFAGDKAKPTAFAFAQVKQSGQLVRRR